MLFCPKKLIQSPLCATVSGESGSESGQTCGRKIRSQFDVVWHHGSGYLFVGHLWSDHVVGFLRDSCIRGCCIVTLIKEFVKRFRR